ncbi:transcriptional regulator family: Fungal Specific TF [Penicillium sp. IBT 16267x]|nr:transcriptional regulator family: Fungal Specific TF [Penicillium sp. IBT 16267x]
MQKGHDDLLESGNDGWKFHLEGAKRLITFHQSLLETKASVIDGSGETMQGIKSIEILGAAFAHPKSVSEFNVPDYKVIQHQESIVRAFLGCPEYLLGAKNFSLIKQTLSRDRSYLIM